MEWLCKWESVRLLLRSLVLIGKINFRKVTKIGTFPVKNVYLHIKELEMAEQLGHGQESVAPS